MRFITALLTTRYFFIRFMQSYKEITVKLVIMVFTTLQPAFKNENSNCLAIAYNHWIPLHKMNQNKKHRSAASHLIVSYYTLTQTLGSLLGDLQFDFAKHNYHMSIFVICIYIYIYTCYALYVTVMLKTDTFTSILFLSSLKTFPIHYSTP